ncbi:hypothetical protein, partial [Duncaniella muris]|uniref:hypothetical protein n=1 Tax=Duncaniella muris TaxID=2094150 RepID=UPI0025A5715B
TALLLLLILLLLLLNNSGKQTQTQLSHERNQADCSKSDQLLFLYICVNSRNVGLRQIVLGIGG